MTRMIEGFFGFEIFDSGILGDYFGVDFLVQGFFFGFV